MVVKVVRTCFSFFFFRQKTQIADFFPDFPRTAFFAKIRYHTGIVKSHIPAALYLFVISLLVNNKRRKALAQLSLYYSITFIPPFAI